MHYKSVHLRSFCPINLLVANGYSSSGQVASEVAKLSVKWPSGQWSGQVASEVAKWPVKWPSGQWSGQVASEVAK